MPTDLGSLGTGDGQSSGANKDTNRETLVLQHVTDHPGAHLRHVQRHTGLALGTTTRVLDRLEAEGKIFSEETGAYRRFFPKDGLHKRERVVLGHLAQDRSRRVLAIVLQNPGIRHSEIMEHMRISPATLTYHLKQLVADEVLLARTKGRARHFRVKNPDLVDRALERWGGDEAATAEPMVPAVEAPATEGLRDVVIGARPETEDIRAEPETSTVPEPGPTELGVTIGTHKGRLPPAEPVKEEDEEVHSVATAEGTLEERKKRERLRRLPWDDEDEA